MLASKRPTHRGFTLVEVLIVVVILGILAAIVVPQFANADMQAKASALATIVREVKSRVDFEHASSRTGAFPDAVSASWFVGNKLPEHPDNTFGLTAIQSEARAGRMHPTDKVLKAGVGGAFWYNPTEGAFRARVADQGSAAATLYLYNLVNHANESDLGNYSGGGWS